MQPRNHQGLKTSGRLRPLVRRWWWLIPALAIIAFPIIAWSITISQLTSRDGAIDHFNLGNTYYRQRNLDQAIAEFDAALRLDSRLSEAHNARGLAYFDKGDLDSALSDFDRAIELKPELGWAYYNRALVHQVSISDPLEQQKARADVKKALEFAEDSELHMAAEAKLKELGGD